MKILGLCTSPRKGMTTFSALKAALEAVRETFPGIESRLIELAEMEIGCCLACGQCTKELACSREDDFETLIPQLSDPEVGGLIVATPVYLGTMTSLCKAFLDRCVMFRRNGFLLGDKVGGVIAVGGVRNGGQTATIQSVHAAMLVHDMIIVGDGKPGAHFGGTMWSGHPDGIDNDETGLATVRSVGRRVAEVARAVHGLRGQ